MATSYYVGVRPVLSRLEKVKGTNPYTGASDPTRVFYRNGALKGAPDRPAVAGAGLMQWILLRKKAHISPLADPNNELRNRMNWPNPLVHKGVKGVLADGITRGPLVPLLFRGVPASQKRLADPGHGLGVSPWVNQGVGENNKLMADPGHTGGGDELTIWKGVPSSKAL